MDNSRSVRLRQTFGGVLQEPEELSQLSSLLMNLLAERHAFHEFHRYEVRAFVLSDLEDLCHVRMTQCGRGFCLAHKAVHPVAIRTDFPGKALQPDFPINLTALVQIHLTHPA